MGWWVAEWSDRPPVLVSWILWVIGSIVLHELAHGWAAIRAGDRTPIETGHMTWNPLVHMGGMSLAMFALVGIAWGQMPVNPRRFRTRHDEARVALAGPATNLALATLAILGGGLWAAFGMERASPALAVNLSAFFWLGAMLNLVLAAFNLLPVPPLDGSSILATYSWKYRELLRSPHAGAITLVVFVLVFFKGGALFGWAQDAALRGIDAVARAFGG